MANIHLDDTLGFFRELVDPNFHDFYADYQSDVALDKQKLLLVFRKMVNLCLTLNHQADKVKEALKYESAGKLIEEITKHYPAEGAALNAVRRFSNDVKHKSKLDQYYTTRKRGAEDRPPHGPDIPEWYFMDTAIGKIAVCDASVKAWLFWGKWFAGERDLLKKST